MTQITTGSRMFGAHVVHTPTATSDSFDQNAIDYSLWVTYNAADPSQVTVTNQQLQITHAITSQYNELTSRNTWSLVGQDFSVQVVDAGDQTIVSHQTIIGCRLDSSNNLFMTTIHGQLFAYKTVATVQTQIGAAITYDAAVHKFWRIRESGGTTFYDTSTDRLTWTNQWSVANPFAMTAFNLYCQSGCYQNELTTSHSYFNDVIFPQSNTSDMTTFKTDSATNPSIILFYQHWGDTDGLQLFVKGWMDTIVGLDAIPMLTWEPWVAGGGPTQSTYSLTNIINGNFDSYITTFATAVAAWGKPFYLRLAHEMNGNWYPWSEQVNGNSAGQFVTMWQYIYALFVAAGATNAKWVWSPNINFSGSPALSGLYPGDSYVDWVAMDGYNWGTDGGNAWTTFTNVFNSTYTDITAITTKPFMIAETGCSENGGSKASWITSAFETEIASFPRIKTLVWFNEQTTTDFRIETSTSATEAFKQAVKYWLTQGKPSNTGRYLKVSDGMSIGGNAT